MEQVISNQWDALFDQQAASAWPAQRELPVRILLEIFEKQLNAPKMKMHPQVDYRRSAQSVKGRRKSFEHQPEKLQDCNGHRAV
jgi:hypothetical protein